MCARCSTCRLEKDVRAMRAIAEETFAMVREYKGSHSGEHGDGIVRSEFHAQMFGPQLVADFKEVKQRFDPKGVLNPGKIVDAPRMDNRTLFRYPPDYRVAPLTTKLDWSAYPGAGNGFQGAVEMCNNNGACRKLEGGVMCPSYRVTREEEHVTRGRANTLRLAISGQLGPDALTSDGVNDALKLCVSCKACRHECPVGVDMAKMKIEVLAARLRTRAVVARSGDWLPAALCRAGVAVCRIGKRAERQRGVAEGIRDVWREFPRGGRAFPASPRRRHKTWIPQPGQTGSSSVDGREVVLFADTFNRHFERENLDAALQVLVKGGYRVHLPKRPAAFGHYAAAELS